MHETLILEDFWCFSQVLVLAYCSYSGNVVGSTGYDFNYD